MGAAGSGPAAGKARAPGSGPKGVSAAPRTGSRPAGRESWGAGPEEAHRPLRACAASPPLRASSAPSAVRRGGQVVRRRSRKPKITGSNPVRASHLSSEFVEPFLGVGPLFADDLGYGLQVLDLTFRSLRLGAHPANCFLSFWIQTLPIQQKVKDRVVRAR